MAIVVHKRGKKRYSYEHKRIDGKVVSTYIERIEDDIDWDEITTIDELNDEIKVMETEISQLTILCARLCDVRDAYNEVDPEPLHCVVCGEAFEYDTSISYVPSEDEDAVCLNTDCDLWAHEECVGDATADLIQFIRGLTDA